MLVNTLSEFCIAFMCGPPGAGKSFVVCVDVVRRLIDSDVRVVTNLPLNVEEVAKFVAVKRGCEPEEVSARIVLIERETLISWRKPVTVKEHGKPAETVCHGPWDWSDEFIANADFILDECHLYCPKKGKFAKDLAEAWTHYLGEARHIPWRRIVFVTQDESKVGEPITSHAELRYELTNSLRIRDPFFRIPLGDWYELRASITREFRVTISIVEYRRTAGKLRPAFSEKVKLDPFYFQFYRSYEAAGGGTGKGSREAFKRQWELRPWLAPVRSEAGRLIAPVWAWFVLKHAWRFTLAASLVGFGWWMILGNGFETMIAQVGLGRRDAKSKVTSSLGPDLAAPAGDGISMNSTAENAKESGESENVAKPQMSLAAAMSKVPPEARPSIEFAMRAATTELKRRDEELAAERAKVAAPVEAVEVEAPLPVVSAFVGRDAAVVEGRKVKQGDSVLLDGGKRRVKVRRIDRAERVVYLEDSRILRFAVGGGVQVVGGLPPERVPTPAPAAVPAGVQPLGQSTKGQSGQGVAAPEKSIVVRRGDAAE